MITSVLRKYKHKHPICRMNHDLVILKAGCTQVTFNVTLDTSMLYSGSTEKFWQTQKSDQPINKTLPHTSTCHLTDKMNKDWLLVITGISVGCAVTMICTTFLKKIAKLCAGCQPRLASQANPQSTHHDNLPSAPMLQWNILTFFFFRSGWTTLSMWMVLK